MALNKVIIKKVKTRTEGTPELQEFLVNLLAFESESHGWWKSEYKTILEKSCKEEMTDADNKN